MRLKPDYTRHIYLKSASLCARAGLHIAVLSLYFMHTHTHILRTITHTNYQRIHSYNQYQLENNQVAMNLSFCVCVCFF